MRHTYSYKIYNNAVNAFSQDCMCYKKVINLLVNLIMNFILTSLAKHFIIKNRAKILILRGCNNTFYIHYYKKKTLHLTLNTFDKYYTYEYLSRPTEF